MLTQPRAPSGARAALDIVTLFGLLLALPCPGSAATPERWVWRNVNIQGFGYVTGLVIHPDTAAAPNRVYIRTDVGGAYRFDAREERWVPLLDMVGVDRRESFGTESVAVDPSAPDRVLLAVNGTAGGGDVLVSADQGITWESTGLAARNIKMDANAPFRGSSGERLVADPNNPDVLFFGSRAHGLWRKQGGGEWQRVAGGLPAQPGNPGCTFVIIDPKSAAPGAPSKSIYVGVYNSGVWHSTDAGETWKNLGAAKNPLRAAIAGDSTLYVSCGGAESGGPGAVQRYRGGAWEDITPGGARASFSGISVDPTDPQTVMVTTNTFRLFRSTRGGARDSWKTIDVQVTDCPPWYRPAVNGQGWGVAAVVIDPNDSRRAWVTDGKGVFRTDDCTVSPSKWVAVMKGLEELVVTGVKCPPVPGGAELLSIHADVVGFRHERRDEPPTKVIQPYRWVAQGSGLDYCQSRPGHCCFVGWDEAGNDPFHGTSDDNGKTWKPFPSAAGRGGSIAMSAGDPENMVWAPTDRAAPKYTVDGGRTWQACKGIGASWQKTDPWWYGEIVAADRLNGKVFYYFDNGAVFYSTDGGATWTAGPRGLPAGVVISGIKADPLRAGHVWAYFRPNRGNEGHKLYRSTDGGKSFAALKTVDRCNFVGFGKGPSKDEPAIYIHGRVGGANFDGIYQSTNDGASWQLLSDPTRNQFANISCLEGDLRIENLVYVGTSGRGILYGRPAAAK